MAKIHTIKVPYENGTTTEAQGKRVKLYVGNIQHHFLLQDYFNTTRLTHYDSGYMLADLSALKMQALLAGRSANDRDAAKCVIEKMVSKYGADEVNRRLNAAPKIN